MKKSENKEMRLYESLGVNGFKRLAFGIRDLVVYPFTIKMSKEERHNFLNNIASNYNIGKVNSLEAVKKYKKQIFLNAGIHVCGFSICLPNFIKVIGGTASLPTTILTSTFMGLNLYCVMLQRYNCIRINELIKRMTPRYERQKDTIKAELKKEDSKLTEHTYKIIDKKGIENNITFDDLISNANIEQLKQYREYLMGLQTIENGLSSQAVIKIPMERHKTLKLELNPNIHKDSAIE